MRAFVHLVHRRDGTERVLAGRVDLADSFVSHARGLMFRRSVPDDYALAFRFDRAGRRSLHMVFVPFDIDVVWVADGDVRKVRRLSAWTGIDWGARADLVVELPAGGAEGVAVGDELRLREGSPGRET